MKHNVFIKAVMLLFAVITFASCEKFNEDEVVENKEANSTLIVRTRAAANDGTEGETESIISYPIKIYTYLTKAMNVWRFRRFRLRMMSYH